MLYDLQKVTQYKIYIKIVGLVMSWPVTVSELVIETSNTGCIITIGAVSICHYGFENAHISKFPTWNETAGVQVLCACVIPLPLFSLGL